MGVAAPTRVKVADEVWIATALLHREHPEREDFTVAEIVERARKESLTPDLRPGVYVHALQLECGSGTVRYAHRCSRLARRRCIPLPEEM